MWNIWHGHHSLQFMVNSFIRIQETAIYITANTILNHYRKDLCILGVALWFVPSDIVFNLMCPLYLNSYWTYTRVITSMSATILLLLLYSHPPFSKDSAKFDLFLPKNRFCPPHSSSLDKCLLSGPIQALTEAWVIPPLLSHTAQTGKQRQVSVLAGNHCKYHMRL